jgi:hypothetical protein
MNLLFAVLLSALPFASPQQSPDDVDLRMAAIRISTAPVIDGVLDESIWAGVPEATGFRQREPAEGASASERTVVRIAYDDAMLYVAAQLFDSEPSLIRATELRRDDTLDSDDRFGVLLDTFHDHRNAFVFRVNPLGTQFDGTVRDEGSRVRADWNEQWEASARITETGWVVEMAIPFKVLRFQGGEGEQEWGLNFERVIKRRNETAHWAGWSLDYQFTSVSQAGHMNGLTGIVQTERLRVRPYLVSGVERLGAVASPTGTDAVLDVGIDDLKLALTSNLTADLTVNPDFAQTEVDQQRVNLTRFSLFFPEKRQFFIEGGDAMRAGINMLHFGPPPLELFYSRRIGLSGGAPQPIMGGGKVTGKVAGFDLGVLSVRTDDITGTPAETFAVGRVRKEILGRSYIGGVFTGRQGAGNYNRVAAADANLIFADHLQVGGMLARSFDSSVEGDGLVKHAAVQWRDDLLQAGFTVLDISSDFDPGIGFVMRKERMMGGSFSLRPRPGSERIRQLELSPSLVYFHDDARVLQTRRGTIRMGATLESGDGVRLDLKNRVEFLDQPFSISPGVTLAEGRREWNSVNLEVRTFNGRTVQATVSGEIGNFWSGTKRSFSVSGSARPSPNLSLQPSYRFNEVDLPEGSFDTHLVGLRTNFSVTGSLLTSAFLQYNSSGDLAAVQVRINYIFRQIDNVFLVYNHTRFTDGLYDGLSNRSLVFKVTYSVHR